MKITRRTFVAGAGAAIAAAGLGGFWYRKLQPTRPNIILFIADDMRYDAAGFNGNTIVQTPNLDALSKNSFVFDSHFVTTSICCSSRASIMSGEYALRHGAYDFGTPMQPASRTNIFFKHLLHAGYHTGFIGKWGIGGAAPKKAFNAWHGYEGQGRYYAKKHSPHLTDIQTGQALQFLRKRPRTKPFLLIVAYKAPHGPLVPQPRFAKLYANTMVPRAKTDTAEAAQKVPPLLQSSFNAMHYKNKFSRPADYQKNQKNYYRLITGMDESIGKILSQISHDNLMDDTLVMFTSDNGLLEGEHQLAGKWCMYEESIRTPMIIHMPHRFAAHSPARITSLSLNIDIAPTLLAAASVSIPQQMQGVNLLDALQGPARNERPGFYYEHPYLPRFNIAGCEGYRGREFKYTRYFTNDESSECLCNLVEDPLEVNNLANEASFGLQLEAMRQKTAEEKKRLKSSGNA